MTSTTRPHPKRVAGVGAAVLLVAIATAYALWSYFAQPNTRQFLRVIDQIQSGMLQENNGGKIDISKSFPGITKRDEIFITRRDDGSFIVLFPYYYGRGNEIAGLLYTSRPMREQDTTPYLGQTTLTQRVIKCAGWSRLIIAMKVDEHWYRVARE